MSIPEGMACTLKQVTIAHHARLLSDWDHTCRLEAVTTQLIEVVQGALSKGHRSRTITPLDCHPFRKSKKQGLAITKDNFAATWKGIAAMNKRRG